MANYGTYTDLARAKGLLGITDDSDDSELLLQLEGASRDIDRHCHRHFYTVTDTRYPEAYDDDGRLWTDDLLAVTSISMDADADATYEATLATTDYILRPLNGWPKTYIEWDRRQGDYTTWPKSVQMGIRIIGTWGHGDGFRASPWDPSGATGTVGTTTGTTLTVSSTVGFGVGQNILVGSEQMYVTGIGALALVVVRAINGTTAAIQAGAAISIAAYPPDIANACIVQAARQWKRRDSAWTNQYGNPAFGVVQVYKGLDPDAERLLGPYVRWAYA